MISKKFSKKSTAEDVTAGLDLTGKTIAITGINSGIGYEAMRVLAMRGAHVIGLARTLDKATQACESVSGNTTPLACELSDLSSVKQCAEQIIAMNIPIDAVICNAGIMALPELVVKDGLEMQFLTNHMGHFLLVYLLQDALLRAEAGRIVMLSSEGHKMAPKGGIDFANLDGSKGYGPWKFYGQSKLANLLTALAFNELLKDKGVCANAVHPGVINTGLVRNMNGALGFLAKFKPSQFLLEKIGGKTIPQGASTECYVAVHPDVAGEGGMYYSDNAVASTSYYGGNLELANQLYEYSINYLADYLPKAGSVNKSEEPTPV